MVTLYQNNGLLRKKTIQKIVFGLTGYLDLFSSGKYNTPYYQIEISQTQTYWMKNRISCWNLKSGNYIDVFDLIWSANLLYVIIGKRTGTTRFFWCRMVKMGYWPGGNLEAALLWEYCCETGGVEFTGLFPNLFKSSLWFFTNLSEIYAKVKLGIISLQISG